MAIESSADDKWSTNKTLLNAATGVLLTGKPLTNKTVPLKLCNCDINNFSNTVLEVILEKQDVGKARYKCVSGEWIGGDINNIYKPLEAIKVKDIIKNMFNVLNK